MKKRILGAVEGGSYTVRGPDGVLMSEYPLAEARDNAALKAAIKRNGWEAVPEA